MKGSLIALFALLTIGIYAQTGSISGQLKTGKTGPGLGYTLVRVEGMKKFVNADAIGRFRIDSVTPGIQQIRLKSLGSRDTVLTVKVEAGKESKLEVIYPPECIYDLHKENRTCPHCGKRDQVIPIWYGLIISTLDDAKPQPEFYTGGCVISGCDPNWYCKRDSLKF